MLALPDEPRWLQAHGISSDPTSWDRSLNGGRAVGNDRAQLVVVFGDADPTAVVSLALEFAQHTFLVVTDTLAAALRTRRPGVERAILHTLPDPDTLPDYEGATLLPSLDAVPAALADELRAADRVWTVFVDGAPSTFAYVPWRSAHWFDISVDTVPGARQLGLATIAAAAMIRDERARGREPVWGADEGNIASLRLAKRLGFVPVDELWIAPP